MSKTTLVLTRKAGERIFIGDVEIYVASGGANRVRLAIKADSSVSISRDKPPVPSSFPDGTVCEKNTVDMVSGVR